MGSEKINLFQGPPKSTPPKADEAKVSKKQKEEEARIARKRAALDEAVGKTPETPKAKTPAPLTEQSAKTAKTADEARKAQILPGSLPVEATLHISSNVDGFRKLGIKSFNKLSADEFNKLNKNSEEYKMIQKLLASEPTYEKYIQAYDEFMKDVEAFRKGQPDGRTINLQEYLLFTVSKDGERFSAHSWDGIAGNVKDGVPDENAELDFEEFEMAIKVVNGYNNYLATNGKKYQDFSSFVEVDGGHIENTFNELAQSYNDPGTVDQKKQRILNDLAFSLNDPKAKQITASNSLSPSEKFFILYLMKAKENGQVVAGGKFNHQQVDQLVYATVIGGKTAEGAKREAPVEEAEQPSKSKFRISANLGTDKDYLEYSANLKNAISFLTNGNQVEADKYAAKVEIALKKIESGQVATAEEKNVLRFQYLSIFKNENSAELLAVYDRSEVLKSEQPQFKAQLNTKQQIQKFLKELEKNESEKAKYIEKVPEEGFKITDQEGYEKALNKDFEIYERYQAFSKNLTKSDFVNGLKEKRMYDNLFEQVYLNALANSQEMKNKQKALTIIDKKLAEPELNDKSRTELVQLRTNLSSQITEPEAVAEAAAPAKPQVNEKGTVVETIKAKTKEAYRLLLLYSQKGNADDLKKFDAKMEELKTLVKSDKKKSSEPTHMKHQADDKDLKIKKGDPISLELFISIMDNEKASIQNAPALFEKEIVTFIEHAADKNYSDEQIKKEEQQLNGYFKNLPQWQKDRVLSKVSESLYKKHVSHVKRGRKTISHAAALRDMCGLDKNQKLNKAVVEKSLVVLFGIEKSSEGLAATK